jgi:hypothetical protein
VTIHDHFITLFLEYGHEYIGVPFCYYVGAVMFWAAKYFVAFHYDSGMLLGCSRLDASTINAVIHNAAPYPVYICIVSANDEADAIAGGYGKWLRKKR